MTSPSLTLAPPTPAAAHVRPLPPINWLALANTTAKSMMIAATAVSAVMMLDMNFGIPWPLAALVMGFLGFAVVSLGEGIAVLLWKVAGFLSRRFGSTRATTFIQAIPAVALGRLLGVFVYIAGDILWPETFLQYIVLPPAGELVILLTGLTAILLTLARRHPPTTLAHVSLIGAAIFADVTLLTWLIQPGYAGYLPPAHDPAAAALALPDPGQPGPYLVQSLSYGSGRDRHRPEYGAEATLITPSVDGSHLFPGYSGLSGRYYQWYWGFDYNELPLNGLVWYPAGEGPFPLVLIVHGNHAMTEPSDPGYTYLGEHLASQGYIAVSVDENFLNGLSFIDGKLEEIPLRAWLLLKHIEQWQAWQETPGSRFYGLVDLDHIALIGHSRGGEAVAQAAEMNADDFHFGIQGVVAIAPSDGYRPSSNVPLNLNHADYLLLAGGHDGDGYALFGQPQYNRTRFTNNPDGFKALAYLYQANHGQFNTVWATRDRGFFNSLLLNRAPLLEGEEQRQAAKVIITAFLEATLRGRDDYRAVFANPAAAPWLPDTLLVTQYADATFTAVNSNRPNSRPTYIDARDSVVTIEGMATADVQRLQLRDGQTAQENNALYLAWEAATEPVYKIELAAETVAAWNLIPQDSLTFALSNTDDGYPAVTDLWIELEAAGGATARLPLSQFGPLYPPLPAYLLKADWLAGLNGFDMVTTTPYETILQTYTIPLVAFREVTPAFDPAALQAIRFVFDGETAGAIYLDQIGFNRPAGFTSEN